MLHGHDPEGGEGITEIKCLISLTIYYKPPNNQNAFLELSSPLMYMFSQETFIGTIFWDQIMVKRNWLVQSAQYQFMFTTNIPQILI